MTTPFEEAVSAIEGVDALLMGVVAGLKKKLVLVSLFRIWSKKYPDAMNAIRGIFNS